MSPELLAYYLGLEFPNERARVLAAEVVREVLASRDPYMASWAMPNRGKQLLAAQGVADADLFHRFVRIGDVVRAAHSAARSSRPR